MKALQLPPEAWLRTNVYNGSITILEVRANGNVSLRTMGDNGHMPPELITYN
jgi:serine/threonine-protein phosphatase PGAM5